MFNRRQFIAGTSLLGLGPLARAQSFPTKPLRMIFPFAAGGSADGLLRYLAQQIGTQLGQQVIVDNRGGGGGAVGLLATANAPKDGYTMLYTTLPGLIINSIIAQRSGPDPISTLEPVALVGATPLAIYAHKSVPANDFPSFVKWVHEQPQGVFISGAGPIIELACARLKSELKINLNYVPFRGSVDATKAIIGGDVPLFFNVPSAPTFEHIKAGTLKTIVVTSAKPSAFFEGVKPLADFVPGYSQLIHYGFWVPPGIPAEAKTRITDAIRKVLAEPGMAERTFAAGMELDAADGDTLRRVTVEQRNQIQHLLQTTPVKFN